MNRNRIVEDAPAPSGNRAEMLTLITGLLALLGAAVWWLLAFVSVLSVLLNEDSTKKARENLLLAEVELGIGALIVVALAVTAIVSGVIASKRARGRAAAAGIGMAVVALVISLLVSVALIARSA